MDDDGLNITNWGYYDPAVKSHLGLQLMPSMPDGDIKPFLPDIKPFLPERGTGGLTAANGILHHHPRDYLFSGPPDHMDYVRDTWINHRDRFLHMFPGNPYNSVLAETSGSHHMQMLQQPDPKNDSRVSMEEPSAQKETVSGKRRSGADAANPPKSKKSRKSTPVGKKGANTSVQRTRAAKKSLEVVINGVDMDISSIPVPVCSCTGAPQQCYRWGCGGWQSACCTTTISMYPLPMSTKRRGARISGRKMSQGAFKKVLEKLAAEGYNFANPIDLRCHWAKHGTNKFVTIR